jgi:iron complex outermembrane receptor protein
VNSPFQAAWTHALSPRSELQLRSYFNHEFRRIPLQLTHRLSTVDVDAQHSVTLTRHGVVWGGGGRVNHDSTEGTALLFFEPRSRTYPVTNVFVQDDIAVVPQRVYLTAGIKYEHNTFSGGAWQPNVRARSLLPRQQMLWGSVARAVRRPTRFDDDIVISSPTGAVLIRGSDDFESERLIATEVGYRLQPVSFFSAEATVFVHHYDRLRSQDAQPGVVPIPLIVGNTLNGRSQGIELAVNLQPVRRWRTHVTYTRLDVEVTRDPDSRDLGGGTTEANDPPYLFGVRSSIDLPRNVDVDARLRSVGRLPNPAVPPYSEMTFRVGWRMTPHVEVAFEGEDLLHDRHGEFNPVARGLEQFERSLRAVLVTRF